MKNIFVLIFFYTLLHSQFIFAMKKAKAVQSNSTTRIKQAPKTKNVKSQLQQKDDSLASEPQLIKFFQEQIQKSQIVTEDQRILIDHLRYSNQKKQAAIDFKDKRIFFQDRDIHDLKNNCSEYLKRIEELKIDQRALYDHIATLEQRNSFLENESTWLKYSVASFVATVWQPIRPYTENASYYAATPDDTVNQQTDNTTLSNGKETVD